MNRTTLVALAALSALSLNAANWRGLDDSNYYSGPKISEADLAGKVVMVDQWGVRCPPCRALLPAMQKLWNANKSKPFVLIGAHCQGRNPEKVKELVDANKLTYPIYDWAGLADPPSSGGGLPFMYVVDHRGKVVYSGRSHEEAEAAVQKAIAAVGAMPTLCGGVTLQAFKAMEKSLVLGKPVKTQVKQLNAAVKKGEAKGATAVQQKQAEEAKEILAAIEEAKTDIKNEIESKRESDPEEAYKLAKAYVTTFPAEGAELKTQLPDMAAKVKERKVAR
jgi:thiol-disulfide isomerase/thioredoxin